MRDLTCRIKGWLYMKAVEKNTGIGSSLFKLVRINDGDCFCTHYGVGISNPLQGFVTRHSTPRHAFNAFQYCFGFRTHDDMNHRAIVLNDVVTLLNLLISVKTVQPLLGLAIKARK